MERSSLTEMEILLQNLLPVGSPVTEQSRPAARRSHSIGPLSLCFIEVMHEF